jgi:uncharacterized repeat protein (TIGR02543 family)
MNSNKTVTANFAVASTYTVTTTATNGSIAVVGSPDNTSPYTSGTAMTLTATANSGYAFSSWTGDVTGTTNPANFNISANKTVTANFTVGGTIYDWEAENLTYTASRSAKTSTGQSGYSNSAAVEYSVLPTAAGTYWIEWTTPSMNAGIYALTYWLKDNNNRGIIQATVDGANVGTLKDSYNSAAVRVQVNAGNTASLSAGTHKIRFTVSSKNSKSKGYGKYVDNFKLTQQ